MLAPSALPEGVAPPSPQWHDVTVVTRRSYQCAKVEAVPPEEFGISRHAKCIRDASYCFHETLRSEAELIGQGYDAKSVQSIPSYTLNDTIESQARDTVEEDDSGGGDDGMNRAARQVKVTEHYIRMDYEGDGTDRLYRVTTGGDESLILTRDGKPDVEEVDAMPFAAMTPVIVTHRFFGRSIADLVMDIQRIKTALLRGMLDHVYRANNPRPLVAENESNESTLDDLLISRHGAPIRAKTATAVVWQTIPDIGGHVYPAIQYMDATREWRTGVTRQGQGLDADALQNQTATAANQLFTAAQARIKLIARIFAETGIKDMFALLHGTIRKNSSQAQTVRLRNQWVSVDPRAWKRRDDMTINVGLGTGGKSEQLVQLQLIIAAQEKAIAAGMVSPKNLYNSAKELSKLAGYKDPDTFFTPPGRPPDQGDPSSAPIQPPQDPKMAELQMKAEIEKLQAQADIETQKAKVAAEVARDDRKAALEERMLQAQHQMKLEEHRLRMAELAMKHVTRPQPRPQGEGGEGQEVPEPQAPSAEMMALLSQMMAPPRPRGMRVVRDERGRVSHTEPMD